MILSEYEHGNIDMWATIAHMSTYIVDFTYIVKVESSRDGRGIDTLG